MASLLYFAPTYFAPTYFPTLAPSQVPKPPVPIPPGSTEGYGDLDAYEAILAALEATGAFASVVFAIPTDRLALAAGATPLVSLVPQGWEEYDDVDPIAILRRVFFSLFVLVRDDDPLSRLGRLAELDTAAHAAFEGSSLGGGCLAALTRLRRAGLDPQSLHPEQAARIDGEFTYIIGPSTIPGANP
ncbi:MAG TPA: hypothetical protein VGH33_25285 [Isosphaeraceae bacterium]